MIPTHFGAIVAALGMLLLWRGSTLAMLRLALLFSLMGGSAAVILSSLGGSTVQPAVLAIAFLLLRCLLPGPGQATRFKLALNDQLPLVVFVLYGVAGAMLLPRIFAGAINVTPLRPIPNGYAFAAFPLSFSPQNITSSVYLCVTLIAALCSHVAAQAAGSHRVIARTAATIAAIHATLGFCSVFLGSTPVGAVLKFFRNGFYAQLDQSFDGFVRMNGIWPEPAVFSAYGFAWFVFVTELWLRDVEKRWTGWGALILGSALFISTSTTAYIGLATFGLILALRIGLLPGSISLRKSLTFIAGGMIGLAALLALLAISAEAAAAFGDFVARFTVDKASSASALQRGFWMRQGLDAFAVSGGLGIGPGSFRSSSLVTAILGSTGVIGSLAVLIYLLRVFKPLHRSTYVRATDPRRATGVAASWAAVVMLIPTFFSAATPDPGFVWGCFCGIALALRRIDDTPPPALANSAAGDPEM